MNKSSVIENRTAIVRHILQSLTREGVDYVILRNPEEVFTSLGHDLDIAVSSRSQRDFEQIIRAFCQRENLKILVTQRRKEFTCFVICDNVGSLSIKIDVFNKFDYRGCTLLEFSDLALNAEHTGEIHIASKNIQLLTVTLKELFHTNKLSMKHRNRINNLSEDVQWDQVREILKRLFGERTGNHAYCMFKDLDYEKLERHSKVIKRKALWKAMYDKPVKSMVGRIKWLLAHFARFAHPSGLFLVMIGPDGSGKSTLSRFLKDKLEHQLFDNVRYYHGHFGFLPKIGSVLKRTPNSNNSDFTKEETPKNEIPHSPIRASVYILYYGLDYFLGRISVAVNRARTNLIVFDRYYHDYYIQNMWIRSPKWLLRIVEILVPKPDLWVFLLADSELINARKPELTVDEINRQQGEMSALKKRLKPSIIVETSGSPEVSAERISAALVENLEERGRTL